MGAYFGGERFVAAGYPVFLFPVLLDHVMSFLVARSHSIYHIGAIHTKLDNEYISLFVRIGWSCPKDI